MKNYNLTIKELFELQNFSIKMGLQNITDLCHNLQNPQTSYPAIHVAGTNGKGSTSVMIQTILMMHGLKVGLYTSPHLVDFRERIRVNSKFVDQKFIIDFWQRIHAEVYRLKATFFDTTTAMAFDYFSHQKIDLAIIETGLGGRLDSTNIVNPVAVIITPISVDHVKQLGRGLKSIAQEKALIIKKGSTLFMSRQKKTVGEIISNYTYLTVENYALSKSVRVSRIEEKSTESQFDLYDKIRGAKIQKIRLNLAGFFQIDNACLAYLAARWYLNRLNIEFEEEKFRKSMSEIQWNGRLQSISSNPDIILDVSHNYTGFKNTLKHIDKWGGIQSRYLIFGLLDDKEYKLIIRLIVKYFKNIVVTEPMHERAISVEILENEFQRYGIGVESYKSIEQAYKQTQQKLTKNDTLLIMGSHYIIGEILNLSSKFS